MNFLSLFEAYDPAPWLPNWSRPSQNSIQTGKMMNSFYLEAIHVTDVVSEICEDFNLSWYV